MSVRKYPQYFCDCFKPLATRKKLNGGQVFFNLLFFNKMITIAASKTLYNLVKIDAQDLARHYPDGIKDICDRKIDGLIIENFLSQEYIAEVVSQLNQKRPFEGSPFGEILIYGPALYVSQTNIETYCQEAIEYREYCRHLFRGGADFEARLEEVLGMMSGGREVTIPKAANGSDYTPSTIRVLEKGQFMGWHFGNQFLYCTPGYKHLADQINKEAHLGYNLTLSEAEMGGELILYDLEWDETEWKDTENGGRKRNGTVNGKLIADVMENYEQMAVKPKAGSLMIFDDSRILHRVSTVKGSRRRITIGGFVAFSQNRKQVYYWS